MAFLRLDHVNVHEELIGSEVGRSDHICIIELSVSELVDICPIALTLCKDNHTIVDFGQVFHFMVQLLHESVLTFLLLSQRSRP
jgi:hypothetical protein